MAVSGDEILVRTISFPTMRSGGQAWQYDSRSDHHSKVSSWGIAFDLLRNCDLMRRHAAAGKIAFGLNHPFVDFRTQKLKKLDLVICRPSLGNWDKKRKQLDLQSLVIKHGIKLSTAEQAELEKLPSLKESLVGNVLVAVEAKACMTEHVKAIPRLHAELDSSHLIVHGTNDSAIAAGFVLMNMATTFISSDRNSGKSPQDFIITNHKQPAAAQTAITALGNLNRRTRPGEVGYDALGVVVVDCKNDASKVALWKEPPAPPPGSTYYYPDFISRIRNDYESRFANI